MDDELLDEIGNDAGDDPRFCGTYPAWAEWEDEVARPRLEAKGWTDLWWWTEEGDSFGPLIRAVRCRRGDETKTFFYG